MTGPPIRLIPLERGHISFLERLVEDPVVRRFTRVPDPPPEGFAELWVERYEHGRRDGSREVFVALLDDEPVAIAVAPEFDRGSATVELGYVVAEHARGRGVATAVLRQLTAWALAEGAERIVLLISVENVASQRVAERCGYALEGVARSAFLKPGVREDTQVWSLLPTDPAGRAAGP